MRLAPCIPQQQINCRRELWLPRRPSLTVSRPSHHPFETMFHMSVSQTYRVSGASANTIRSLLELSENRYRRFASGLPQTSRSVLRPSPTVVGRMAEATGMCRASATANLFYERLAARRGTASRLEHDNLQLALWGVVCVATIAASSSSWCINADLFSS